MTPYCPHMTTKHPHDHQAINKWRTPFKTIWKEQQPNLWTSTKTGQLEWSRKADLIVINNMIKTYLCSWLRLTLFQRSIISEHLCWVSSQQGLQAWHQAPKEKHPDPDNVLQEIKKIRTRVNNHQNNQADSFKQKAPENFTLFDLITNRKGQLLSVKGKPISFKSRSKGTVDIKISNPKEFSSFLQ